MVQVTAQDLVFQQKLLEQEALEEGLKIRKFTEPFLERAAIQRKIAEALLDQNVLLLHGSTVAVDGEAYLFTAACGTGKSTHTRLWREVFGTRAVMINDDKPFLKISAQGVTAYGSPWSGKTPCYRDLSYPIAGFCRLSQAPHNAIRRLNVIAALGALLPSCPPQFGHDTYLQDCICNTLDQILRKVGVYHLECLPDSAAAHLSHSTIIKGDA